MSDVHITRELLRAVSRGDLPARTLIEIGLDHLTSLCPFCREEFQSWRKEQTVSYRYDAAFQVLPAVLERHQADIEKRRKEAARDFRELLRLSQEERLLRTGRANARFRGVFLAERLLQEAKSNMPADFEKVRELAEAADAVLRRTAAGPGVAELSARSLAYMANALRMLGNPHEARRLFLGARHHIRHEGVTDPYVCAEVDWFEGALLMDQRRFGEAEELLARAITLYTLSGDKSQAARPMLTLGTLYYNRGDIRKAAETTQAALDIMPPGEDPRFFLYARHNLSWYLVEAGHFSTAAGLLEEDRERYREFPDAFTQLRLLWLEGRIALGLGHRNEAEKAFQVTRQGFVRERNGYDAAMVSLDLAMIYVEEKRPAELRELATEMHELFSAEDVHREAVAALLLFEEAIRQETLTVEGVRDFSVYLEAARNNPTLRFKKSS